MTQIRCEWQKIRATPTMWWLLLGVVLLTVVAAVGSFALQEAADAPRLTDQALRSDLHSVGTGSFFVAVAGMIGMGGEFRFGQADQTFITTPRRSRVLAAKSAVFALLGLVYGVIACLVALGSMATWFAMNGQHLPWSDSSVHLTILGSLLSAVAFGVLGVALGALTRNQVVAIVGGLAWLLIIEPIIFQGSAIAGRWLPGQAAEGLRRVPVDDLLGMLPGGMVLLGWLIALLVGGAAVLRRYDVLAG